MDEAHDFLIDVIGCEFVYSLPGSYGDSAWNTKHLNVPKGSAIKEIRFYRCGAGSSFEVFEYSGSNRTLTQPRNSDVGGHHLALYVDDIEAAVQNLRENNVEILGGTTSSTGPSEGQSWVYFLSPWGMQFELVSYPGGKRYEANASTLLWDPRESAE